MLMNSDANIAAHLSIGPKVHWFLLSFITSIRK